MNGGKIESIDRISELPTCILSDILLRYLTLRDATRTCVLSQSWNALGYDSRSLPHLMFNFDQTSLIGEDLALYTDERQAKFFNLVEESMHMLKPERFRISPFRISRFSIRINVFHPEISSSIDRLLQLATARNIVQRLMLTIRTGGFLVNLYKFPNIELASIGSGSLMVLHLVGCKLQPSSLCDRHGNAWPLPLEVIYLRNVKVDNQDNIFQEFIDRCSSLKKLTIEECYGVKTLRLCNHPKLKELHVTVKQEGRIKNRLILNRIEVNSLDLHTITCSSVKFPIPLIVRAACCKNLRKLEITNALLKEHFVQSISTKFPFLLALSLSQCRGLNNLSLRHPLLKTLRLRPIRLNELAVIDTPNLRLFEYAGFDIPTKLVFSNASSSSTLLRKSEFVFFIGDHYDTCWFLRLRDHLGKFNKHDLTLSLKIPSLVEFQLNEVATLDLPCHVQVLNLHLSGSSGRENVMTLIDGLFWSCRPKYLRLNTYTTVNIDCLQVIFENLRAAKEQDPICCQSRHIKCWRHFLTDITIKRTDTTNTAFSEVESVMQRLAARKNVLFALNWL